MGRKLVFPRGKLRLSLLNLPVCHWRDKVGSAPTHDARAAARENRYSVNSFRRSFGGAAHATRGRPSRSPSVSKFIDVCGWQAFACPPAF